jgi:hypothetical protein
LANSESSFASFRKRSALLTGPCKVNTRFHPRPIGIGGEGKDSNLPIRFPVLRTKRVRCFRPLGHLSPSPHHQPRLQNVKQHAHPHTPLIWGGDDMFRGDAAAGAKGQHLPLRICSCRRRNFDVSVLRVVSACAVGVRGPAGCGGNASTVKALHFSQAQQKWRKPWSVPVRRTEGQT